MSFRLHSLSLALVGLSCASALQAQTADSIVFRAGATQISPNVTSGDLSAPAFAGTKADIHSDTQPTGGVTWMLTDNLALDLPLGLGFTHEIVGAGAIAGVGKLGETKALPISLLVQYRFMGARDKVRPYVGLGPTYAKFYDERSTAVLTALTGGTPTKPTTLSMESKWALTAQVGVSVMLNRQWGLDATILKTKLSSRATLSTGQTLDAKVDPTAYSVGVTYLFN